MIKNFSVDYSFNSKLLLCSSKFFLFSCFGFCEIRFFDVVRDENLKMIKGNNF